MLTKTQAHLSNRSQGLQNPCQQPQTRMTWLHSRLRQPQQTQNLSAACDCVQSDPSIWTRNIHRTSALFHGRPLWVRPEVVKLLCSSESGHHLFPVLVTQKPGERIHLGQGLREAGSLEAKAGGCTCWDKYHIEPLPPTQMTEPQAEWRGSGSLSKSSTFSTEGPLLKTVSAYSSN